MNRKHFFLGILVMFVAAGAGAQSFQSDIEEIIVVAQKREQSVMEVPIAIDVLAGEGLRARGATSLIDIAQYSPGLNIRGPFGDFSYPLVSLRGVNTDGFVESISQSTGVYTDGIFISSPAMLALRILDLERIEVLKGPQGTLYGRNTIGGAINFISRKPTFEKDGYITAGYGRYDNTSLEAAVGGGLSDTVAARAAVKYVRQTDSPLTNTFAGQDDGGEIDQLYGRLSFLFQPGDDFDARVEFHTGRDRSDSWPFALIPAGEDVDGDGTLDQLCADFINGNAEAAQVNCYARDAFGTGAIYNNDDGDPFTNNLDQDGPQNKDADGAVLEMNWRFSDMKFSSLTGWDQFKRRDETDEDAGPYQVFGTFRNSNVEQFSQEFRLSSESDSVLQWITGLYYSDDELEGDPSFTNASGRSDYNRLETETMGVFGQADYSLWDDVTITFGGRWTSVERDVYYRTTANGFGNSGVSDDLSDDEFSARLALDYQASEGTLIYASLSRGFNAGTYNTGFLTSPAAFEPTDSETILAWEAGFKSIIAEGSASIEGAVFYYDYQDIQLVAVEPADTIAANRLINADDATLYGFEAQLRASAAEWLDLNFGVAYIDSEIGSASTLVSGTGTGSTYPYNAAVFGSTPFDLKGQPLPNHPEWSVNGSARAQVPISAGWIGFCQVDVLWEDEIPRDLIGTRALYTEDKWNLDAQIGVESGDGRWQIYLWGRNLTDELYFTEAYEVIGFGFYVAAGNYVYPRTYGLKVSWNM